MRHIELITTGGTIEKTYDEHTQELANSGSVVRRMLSRLKLPDTQIHVRELMHKDSVTMTDADRDLVCGTAAAALALSPTVVVLHGTDTLALTAERLVASLPEPSGRVVFTGAMRPYEMKRSDALQNLTEALIAATILPPGIYCVMHGNALRFPGTTKDDARLTFVGPPAIDRAGAR